MDAEAIVNSVADQGAIQLPWGHIVWLVGAAQMPGAEQTLGVVTIYHGHRNPLHAHPNCEELLYVVSGECEHKLGDDLFHLLPGSVIRIPRGVRHWARCTSAEALVCLVSFSAPDRRTDSFEGDELA